MNCVKVTYQEIAFIFKDNIYKFSNGLINFHTKAIIKYGDIDEDKNKSKTFC